MATMPSDHGEITASILASKKAGVRPRFKKAPDTYMQFLALGSTEIESRYFIAPDEMTALSDELQWNHGYLQGDDGTVRQLVWVLYYHNSRHWKPHPWINLDVGKPERKRFDLPQEKVESDKTGQYVPPTIFYR
jgi:hypothetical protein